MKYRELIIYRDPAGGEILEKTAGLIEAFEKGLWQDPASLKEASEDLYSLMHDILDLSAVNGFYGNLWHCMLANLLVSHENAYSKACEIRGQVWGSINQAALHDFEIFRTYFDYDFSGLMEKLEVPVFSLLFDFEPSSQESKVYNSRIRDRICELAVQLESTGSAEEMKDAVTEFYREYGVGRFGLHKAFRIVSEEGDRARIVPIKNILHVHLDDLIGYETAKARLVENTEAFIEGRPANNVLLYGEAGTGKSSSIKAIANQYFDRGLRIIEIYRHQFRDLNDVISQIKGRNYRFIIYMDDLSFEEFETEYKYLKAVIEGGLEKKPSNVLIYATSNRRHLVRESFKDRDGDALYDKHGGDTVNEKLSLAGRFGLSIYFGSPEFDEFQHIVAELAKRHGIDMDEKTLRSEATKWQMRHGGLSGRTAQQFIDSLLGKDIKKQ